MASTPRRGKSLISADHGFLSRVQKVRPAFSPHHPFFKQSTKVDCRGRIPINHAVDILRSAAEGSYIVAVTNCICSEFSRSVRARFDLRQMPPPTDSFLQQ
jgi:hypothetical protein